MDNQQLSKKWDGLKVFYQFNPKKIKTSIDNKSKKSLKNLNSLLISYQSNIFKKKLGKKNWKTF